MEDDSFTTGSIATAAAVLTAGEQSSNPCRISEITSNPKNNRKTIHIVPRSTALGFFEQLIAGDLMINAQENQFWVEKLKTMLFADRGMYGK
jgi:hypothetical protein